MPAPERAGLPRVTLPADLQAAREARRWSRLDVARLGNNTAYAHQLIDQLRRRYPQSPEATRLGQQGDDNEPQTYQGGAHPGHGAENGQ